MKESLFNIVQFDIEGRRVLDMFAGTGQLGIEALSRGAESAVFVDSRRDAARLVQENLQLTGLADKGRVCCGDAMAYLASLREKFDIVFLDPPYHTGLLQRALEHLVSFDILRQHGIIVCESAAEEELSEVAAPYRLYRTYRYGKIKLTIYHREGDADA